MKRVIVLFIIVIILFCFCASAFAQDNQGKNLMTDSIVANILPGFGIGSLFQKNKMGFGLQFFAEISSYLSLIFYAIESSSYNYDEEKDFSGFLFYGLMMLGASKTFGIIAPIVYEKQGITPVAAMFLNTFLGFGFGSYFQKDQLSMLFMFFDCTFTLFLIGGLCRHSYVLFLREVGAIGLSISKLFSIISPFFYRENKADIPALWVSILNFFIGAGAGSFLIEDKIGLIIQGIFESIGYASGLVSFIGALFSAFSFQETTFPIVFLSIGIGFVIVSRIFGFIRPFVFRNEQKAKNEDNPDENESTTDFIVLPVFSIKSDGKFVVGFSLSF